MKTIYASTFDRGAYTQYLAGQLAVFREMERLCDARRGEEPLRVVYDEALLRTAALERDLCAWCGGDQAAAGRAEASAASGGSPQTARYLDRLRADAGDAWMLTCHHFLQYNAVLSGGQFLGTKVSERAASDGIQGGSDFYAFGPSCQPTHARVQRYLDDFDSLPITQDLRERMLPCMQDVYAILLGTFDEAYAVAPVAGMSYEESKHGADAGTTSAKKKKGPPPPPLEPAPRSFTLKEMSAFGGQVAGEVLLTSVLGRVYDVSPARDLFGPGGPYAMFAGRDGTYNLAVMSLKKPTLDKFEYDLDDEDRECLSDWIAYFDNRYGQPVGSLSDRQHAVALKDLPKATRIPFADMDDDDEEDSSGAATQPPAAATPAAGHAGAGPAAGPSGLASGAAAAAAAAPAAPRSRL